MVIEKDEARAVDFINCNASEGENTPLIDPFGRTITYLRMSVTDRCDLRCAYCMPEQMQFLPKADLLSLEELERLIMLFIRRGVRKVRLTGGEPLVRKGIEKLIGNLGTQVKLGTLDEITLTTNGTQLAKHAEMLAKNGVKRVNVSLDTLDPAIFKKITRRAVLEDVLDGIEAAQSAGISIKINTVALKEYNGSNISEMIKWAHARGIDMTLIEIMPMGEVDEDRFDQYLPLSAVRKQLEQRWTLTPMALRTGGPSHYLRVEETGGTLGLITPLTQNFCDECNRVRLTCTGKLYLCLGQDNHVDFRMLMRSGADDSALDTMLDGAISGKPKGHEFAIKRLGSVPAVKRQMSVTGG